jgi:hypothetical protein
MHTNKDLVYRAIAHHLQPKLMGEIQVALRTLVKQYGQTLHTVWWRT